MTSYTIYHERKAKADRRGGTIILLCVLGFGCVASFYVLNQRPPRDAATGCITGKTTPFRAVVTVDKTDPWPAAQTDLLNLEMLHRAAQYADETHLTIYPFTGAASHPPSAVFDRCKPAICTAEWRCTPAAEQRKFDRQFRTPLTTSVTTLTESPTDASQTHLVAFLASIGARLKYQPADRRSIAIYSDMAENNEAISPYPNVKAALTFTPAAFSKHFAQVTRGRLAGITLDINVIETPHVSPTIKRRIKAAWQAALKDAGISYTWKDLAP